MNTMKTVDQLIDALPKSGYSMGDTFIIRVAGKVLGIKHVHEKYAKSCKYRGREQYGQVELKVSDWKEYAQIDIMNGQIVKYNQDDTLSILYKQGNKGNTKLVWQ